MDHWSWRKYRNSNICCCCHFLHQDLHNNGNPNIFLPVSFSAELSSPVLRILCLCKRKKREYRLTITGKPPQPVRRYAERQDFFHNCFPLSPDRCTQSAKWFSSVLIFPLLQFPLVTSKIFYVYLKGEFCPPGRPTGGCGRAADWRLSILKVRRSTVYGMDWTQ